MCNHSIIESDNFLVCVKCAFVQDVFLNDKTPCKNIISDEEYPTSKKFKCKHEILKELESRGVINNIILNEAIFYMNKWSNEKIPLQKIHHAYAVYYSARRNNHPLSLKEISFYLNLSVKEICKVEKYIKNDFFDSPYDYLSKYCALLDLTFMDEKIIKSYLEENYKMNHHNPSHIAASAIAIVFPSIEKRKISLVTWTATSTIKKISGDLQKGKFK
jgi:transcription initiation factor TFIIIB Brf1 subunit/transcription initiation factor TFIIB